MKKLSNFQFSRICRIAESGEFISLLVQKAMKGATEKEIDIEIERIYDSIEFP